MENKRKIYNLYEEQLKEIMKVAKIGNPDE